MKNSHYEHLHPKKQIDARFKDRYSIQTVYKEKRINEISFSIDRTGALPISDLVLSCNYHDKYSFTGENQFNLSTNHTQIIRGQSIVLSQIDIYL